MIRFAMTSELSSNEMTLLPVLIAEVFLVACENIRFSSLFAADRLQNSPYFCVFKYARAVKG